MLLPVWWKRDFGLQSATRETGMEPELLDQLQKGEIVENETGKHIGLWTAGDALI